MSLYVPETPETDLPLSSLDFDIKSVHYIHNLFYLEESREKKQSISYHMPSACISTICNVTEHTIQTTQCIMSIYTLPGIQKCENLYIHKQIKHIQDTHCCYFSTSLFSTTVARSIKTELVHSLRGRSQQSRSFWRTQVQHSNFDLSSAAGSLDFTILHFNITQILEWIISKEQGTTQTLASDWKTCSFFM